jgi:hypothetical protein
MKPDDNQEEHLRRQHRERLLTAPSLTRVELGELVKLFEHEMVYDAHPPETSFNRSDGKDALLRHGLPAMWAVARRLNKMRTVTARSPNGIGFMYLLFKFCRRYSYQAPYTSKTRYIDMTLARWRQFIYEPKVRVPVIEEVKYW